MIFKVQENSAADWTGSATPASALDRHCFFWLSLFLIYTGPFWHNDNRIQKILLLVWWKVLHRSQYWTDIHPSYYLIKTFFVANRSTFQTSTAVFLQRLCSCTNSKYDSFLHRGIHILRDRYENVITNDGQYTGEHILITSFVNKSWISEKSNTLKLSLIPKISEVSLHMIILD